LRLSWFFALFFVSGFCSLVYEIVWLRLAMASFGVTTPLVSLVVSVFMAGLALGSWLAGRLARTARSSGPGPLRVYVLIELLIAVSGIAVPVELEWGRALLERTTAGAAWGSSAYYLASGGLVAAALLPFCVGMGATFPLGMWAIRAAVDGESERSFSYLYLANVLGATLGTLAAAFVMIELLGLRRTLLATASVNVLMAAVAFAVSLGVPGSHPARLTGAEGEPSARAREGRRLAAPGLLFLTGFASMAMELVWVRQFAAYLGTVVYAFATILAVYLAATFLGSSAYRVRARRHKDSPGPGAGTWAVAACLGLVPLATADPRLPLADGFFPATLRVGLGIAPFCAAIGFLTPLLVDRWSRGDASRAGAAYAVNVVGGILGPLAAGFGLLPSLGERGALLGLAAALWGTGAVMALRPSPALTRRAVGRARAAVAATGVLALLLVALTRDFESLFHPRLVRRDETATVIATGEGRRKRLLVNGFATTYLTPITKLMVHLPMAFLPDTPRSALVICFGMGTSFRSSLSWGVPTTAVELARSVPTLFGYYHEDAPALLRTSSARIVIDDGRRYLERTPELHDLITVDPPPPVQAAGSSLLYSREFYTVAQKRLRPAGILQQWLPGGEPIVVSSVARALRSVFPHVRVFKSVEGWGYHFLASARPLPIASAQELAARLPPPAVADLVEWGPASTAVAQFEAVLSREVPLGLVMLLDLDAPVLQDDVPVNEYYLLRQVFRAPRA